MIRDALSAQAAAETIESDAERRQVIDAITAMPEQRHIIGEDQPLSRKANLDTNVFRKVRDVVGQDGDGNFKLQRFRTLYQQMMLPVVLRETLPTGLLGLLSLLMIMLVLSTDDSRIFNASATILQDVIMPLRKEPFTPRQHLLRLRLCSVGVAGFFLTFSLWFVQLDYLNMFMVIMTSIWLGGAGPVMIGGFTAASAIQPAHSPRFSPVPESPSAALFCSRNGHGISIPFCRTGGGMKASAAFWRRPADRSIRTSSGKYLRKSFRSIPMKFS